MEVAPESIRQVEVEKQVDEYNGPVACPIGITRWSSGWIGSPRDEDKSSRWVDLEVKGLP